MVVFKFSEREKWKVFELSRKEKANSGFCVLFYVKEKENSEKIVFRESKNSINFHVNIEIKAANTKEKCC